MSTKRLTDDWKVGTCIKARWKGRNIYGIVIKILSRNHLVSHHDWSEGHDGEYNDRAKNRWWYNNREAEALNATVITFQEYLEKISEVDK